MTKESTEIAILDLSQLKLPMCIRDMLRNGVDAVPSNRMITTVADIDELVYSLQNQIDFLHENRERLMRRISITGVSEDSGAMLIEIPNKKERNPIVDIEGFKQKFPESYRVIRDNQKEEIERKYKENMETYMENPIPLLLADRCTGKDNVTEFVGFKPQKIRYEVRRKSQTQQERLI